MSTSLTDQQLQQSLHPSPQNLKAKEEEDKGVWGLHLKLEWETSKLGKMKINSKAIMQTHYGRTEKKQCAWHVGERPSSILQRQRTTQIEKNSPKICIRS